MSLSKEERLLNLANAAALLVQHVGEKQIREAYFHQTDHHFSIVLQGTWKELEDRYYIHEPQVIKGGDGYYFLTPTGWLFGMEVVWDQNKVLLDEMLGKLGAALKGRVKGRHDDEMISLEELATATGLPTGWVFNAIESDLYGYRLNRKGASWEGSARGHFIHIPLDFGLEKL